MNIEETLYSRDAAPKVGASRRRRNENQDLDTKSNDCDSKVFVASLRRRVITVFAIKQLEADAFASELLIPVEQLKKFQGDLKSPDKLAGVFQVSRPAMAIGFISLKNNKTINGAVMGDHLAFERYFWFDNQIRAGKFPNAVTLAEKYECSSKTAQRAIAYMRDRLQAPLEYDSVQHGYFYSDTTFELPSLQVSQEELLAILLAQNILSNSAGGSISELISKFGKRLFVKMGDLGLDKQRMEESFSSTWNEYAPAEGQVFQKVTKALLENRVLGFSYTSPKERQPTARSVEPHHLQHYMGSWTMIGFCRLRNDWRRFMLSRMTELELAKVTFKPQPKSEWVDQVGGGFGIFQGGKLKQVTLRFNPFRAAWIKEQIWHPKQAIKIQPDGSLDLTFPVCEYHEVKMKILQFGGDVEVLEPLGLRDEVREEIEKMAEIFGKYFLGVGHWLGVGAWYCASVGIIFTKENSHGALQTWQLPATKHTCGFRHFYWSRTINPLFRHLSL